MSLAAGFCLNVFSAAFIAITAFLMRPNIILEFRAAVSEEFRTPATEDTGWTDARQLRKQTCDVEKETDMVWVVLSRSEQITFLRKVTKMLGKSLLGNRFTAIT
jgi:hypothetical protein